MKLSVCTISFRHHLFSIDEIANWAIANHFSAIELWGAHARNLIEKPDYNSAWIREKGLYISMLSDYLPIDGDTVYAKHYVQSLARIAHHWQTQKIRTFAGGQASSSITQEERSAIIQRIRLFCDWLAEFGHNLIIEIHPNTLADTVESTLQLIEEVNQPNLKINFDVLHVWESYADPIKAIETLSHHIQHFHFKNIRSRAELKVFTPPNVYAASGDRDGMVSLFEGAVDYQQLFEHLVQRGGALSKVDASLEWFGPDVYKILNQDRYAIQRYFQDFSWVGQRLYSSSDTRVR